MLRRIRCRSCGSPFYTTDPTAECQSCTDSHDESEQATKDAAAIRATNSVHETESQSYDPRTGAPSKAARKKEKAK